MVMNRWLSSLVLCVILLLVSCFIFPVVVTTSLGYTCCALAFDLLSFTLRFCRASINFGSKQREGWNRQHQGFPCRTLHFVFPSHDYV